MKNAKIGLFMDYSQSAEPNWPCLDSWCGRTRYVTTLPGMKYTNTYFDKKTFGIKNSGQGKNHAAYSLVYAYLFLTRSATTLLGAFWDGI